MIRSLPLVLTLVMAGCGTEAAVGPGPAGGRGGQHQAGADPSAGSGGRAGAPGGSSALGGSQGGAPEPVSGAAGGGAASGGAAGAGGEQPLDPLVHAHFSTTELGVYDRADVAADFGAAPTWDNGLGQGRATIEAASGERFLRVTYPSGTVGPAEGGVQFVVDLHARYEELFFAYRVRFQAGFSFNMGGKLPGLVGGSSPTGCKPAEDGFSARNMWRGGGAIVQYVYWPDQPKTCGDDRFYQSGGANVVFEAARWMRIEHRVKMNTVGLADGVLEAWVDGQQTLSETDRQWRKTNDFGIDALYFSTFFGGSSEAWASPQQQHVDFDDLVVDDEPITH